MVSKLDLYRVFCTVGKCESFSQAARELFMTQPAVSQSIMQLENELDTRLFNRTPKGVTLTDEGSLLFEYIQSAINLIDVGEEKISEFKNLTTGELKIGVGDTISRYYLLPYLEAFHTRYPSIKIKIFNGTTLELITVLKSGGVDIAICNLPVNDSAIEARPSMQIQDIFVCGEKYKTFLSKPIAAQELEKFPLIMLEPKSNSRRLVEDALFQAGVKIAPEFELGSHDLLLEFARINLGIASVVKEFSLDYLQRGVLHEVELTEPLPPRNIGVCFLKSVPLSPASTRFVDIIENRQNWLRK